MAISDRFDVDFVNKIINHNGSNGSWWTVNQLYSWLQDYFDELDQMDDPVPMDAQTPTDYRLINGWFIDDQSFRFLKGGAITTSGYASNAIIGISYDATDAGTGFDYTYTTLADYGRTITGTTTGDTGTIVGYDQRYGTELGVVWIRPDDSGDLFDDNDENYTVAGSSAAGVFTSTFNAGGGVSGEHLYSNVYTLGTIQEDDSQQIYIVQNGATIDPDWWPEPSSGTQHIDVLIKVRECGSLINAGELSIYLRHYPDSSYGDLYDHFIITVSGGGRNAVPLATQNDLNNLTGASTVGSTYNDISIIFVNGLLAVGSVTTDFAEFDAITWTGNTLGAVVLEYSGGNLILGNVQGTAPANTDTIYVANNPNAVATGDMTAKYTINKAFDQGSPYPYTVVVDCNDRLLSQVYEYFKYTTRELSTFVTYPLSRSTAGTLTHAAQDGNHYIRAYVDNQTSANSYTPVKASPFGTYAGGTLFAAQGVWLQDMNDADIKAYQLIDTGGNTRVPPNKQVISVTNLTENDRVTVFRTESVGSAVIDKSLYGSTTDNTTGASTFIVSTTITADTPASGIIRTVDNTDLSEERYSYSAFSGSTFFLTAPTATLSQNYNDVADTAYVPYIDEEVGAATDRAQVTVIFVTDRGLLIRVRRKLAPPIQPFELTGTFASSGYTTSALRTPDTIVT